MNEQGSKLINFLSHQNEFQNLKAFDPNKIDKEQLLYDPNSGKLNLRLISADQLIFLYTVFQNDELQQKYIQLMMKETPTAEAAPAENQ